MRTMFHQREHNHKEMEVIKKKLKILDLKIITERINYQ